MRQKIKHFLNTIKKKFGNYTSVCANLCQILIVVLAIVEYQKNIKPTFQNQLLSEENAKLTLENMKLQEETSRINEALSYQINEKERQIKLLQDKYTDINNQYEIAYGKLQALETEQEKKERLIKIQKEKEEIVNSIYVFKKEILKNCGASRSNLILNETLDGLSKESKKEELTDDDNLYIYPLQNIDKMISKYFYNPYTRIYKSLDIIQSENLKNENKQTSEYMTVFKSILKEKEAYIIFDQNKVINLEKELKEYKKQLEVLEGITIKADINILNKRWQIENTARKAVQEVEESLIDYGDIMKPVIDEMTSYYLNKYKIEEY